MMSDALFRFRMLGTRVEIGWTAVLLMVWIATMTANAGWGRVILHTGVILGSILMHEQGHALAGRALGLRVHRIVLHGMGGLCQFDRAPRDREGLLTSLAGPLAGLGLAALSWGLILGTGGGTGAETIDDVLYLSLWINLIWSLFNLVPMYPLDGGQALFYGLRIGLGPGRKALEFTRWISMGTAAAVGLYSFLVWGLLIVPLIAAFSAYQSWKMGRP
jgi:stage IV sporulation protein FB